VPTAVATETGPPWIDAGAGGGAEKSYDGGGASDRESIPVLVRLPSTGWCAWSEVKDSRLFSCLGVR
jgi:hypothetical protein